MRQKTFVQPEALRFGHTVCCSLFYGTLCQLSTYFGKDSWNAAL